MQRVNPADSQYTNYLPACVKCRRYKPSGDLDPFSDETQCAEFGEIPKGYLLMSDACPSMDIDSSKAFVDVGDRPLTMLERMAADR